MTTQEIETRFEKLERGLRAWRSSTWVLFVVLAFSVLMAGRGSWWNVPYTFEVNKLRAGSIQLEGGVFKAGGRTEIRPGSISLIPNGGTSPSVRLLSGDLGHGGVVRIRNRGSYVPDAEGTWKSRGEAGSVTLRINKDRDGSVEIHDKNGRLIWESSQK